MLVFLTGLVSCLIIKGATAINIGGGEGNTSKTLFTRTGHDLWRREMAAGRNKTKSDWKIVSVKCEMCLGDARALCQRELSVEVSQIKKSDTAGLLWILYNPSIL